MSEKTMSTIKNQTNELSISTLLISDVKKFCSFIISHPLYILYMLFFSPYLLKLISFVFPLVFTTSLFFLESLRSNTDDHRDGDGHFNLVLEDFEAYKIVFEGPIMEIVQDNPTLDFQEQSSAEEFKNSEEENNCFKKIDFSAEEFKNSEKENDGVEKVDFSETTADVSMTRIHENDNGSMRKGKEWNRTLACKLYEERNGNGGCNGEAMDLLWETYELDSKKRGESKRRGEVSKRNVKEKEDEEEDEEEREMNDGLCCLQALKFSAGKMNLGMGKPNLVKISKAIKGFGWIKRVTKHKRSKKVHVDDDRL